MLIHRLIVKNWRNFQHIDVELQTRQFIIGPNASGKSNLLDIFRFLRDIAKPGGGFQKAVSMRGGVAKLRHVSAPRDAEVVIEIRVAASPGAPEKWRYRLGFCGHSEPSITHECLWKKGTLLQERSDALRATQSFLENSAACDECGEFVRFLGNVTYLHLVPQFLRFPGLLQDEVIEEDPFGQRFLEKIASVSEPTRCARLEKIESALQIAVPRFERLAFIRDEQTGHPHLQARYADWPPEAAWHREDQFSDGTLRLIALFWSLFETDSVILLEEPEFSFTPGIISQFATLIAGTQLYQQQQVFVTTHSTSLLAEQGIVGTEVLVLTPTKAETKAELASDITHVQRLLQAGFTAGEVLLSGAGPQHAHRLSLLGWD